MRRGLAALGCALLCPVGAAAQQADIADVIASLEETFALSEPQILDDIHVESISLDIAAKGDACELSFEMRFDTSDPPSIATITASTDDMDPDTIEVDPMADGTGSGILYTRTRGEAPLYPFEIQISEGGEIYAEMYDMITEGYADGTCEDGTCLVQGFENDIGIPLSPTAGDALVEQTVDNMRTLIALCATAPADAG